MNEAGDYEQDISPTASELALLSSIEDLISRLNEGDETETVEEARVHSSLMATMYDLVAKRIKNISGEDGCMSPEEYALATETVIDDCQVHGEDMYTGLAIPEEVTGQDDEKYQGFRHHSIRLAHTLFGNEFGDQAAEAFRVFQEARDDEANQDIG